jgi:hypothetical protein
MRRLRSTIPTLKSCPRKRERRVVKRFWIPACAGMTVDQTFLNFLCVLCALCGQLLFSSDHAF